MIERLRAAHGPLVFFQSGGCCDGSSPMCLRAGELPPAPGDVRLGEIGGAAFYIDADQDERWRRPDFVIDVAPGAADELLARGARGRALRLVRTHRGDGRGKDPSRALRMGDSPTMTGREQRTGPAGRAAVLERRDFDALVDALSRRGYTVVGPTVRDRAIVYDEIALERRPPGRLDRRAGRRALPAAPARRRGAVRLRRRPALLEALPAAARRAPVAGASRRATGA